MVNQKHPAYKKSTSNKTILSWAYPDDLDQIYAFYCSRYENISWEEFMQLGYFEIRKKIESIPESEPLLRAILLLSLGIMVYDLSNEPE